MERSYFGYIRVSTAKQGEKGVSLQEQTTAIAQYAQRYSLRITQWFEERESAAKRGRPVFMHMMRDLRQGKAQGVIIHKIDRSARNLKDWADLGELIDAGLEVHFANESLDLNTRGGRLSADIQAVVAADYIRNLREETRKGFYGRLKQGLYPLPAPLGYLDRGKGKMKEVDVATAPIIAKAFELYSSRQYPLHRLLAEMHRLGLRNRQGVPISLTGLSTILNNPFYMGMIRLKRTGEVFPGVHRPLVSKALFGRVQLILDGKTVDRLVRHDFTYRRLVRCARCGRSLIGELQKRHVYYRCQTRLCPTKTIREELIEETVVASLSGFKLDDEEIAYVQGWMEEARSHRDSLQASEMKHLTLQLDSTKRRLNRLTDLFIDSNLEKLVYDERRAALIIEEREIQERIRSLEVGNGFAMRKLEEFLELARNTPLLYESATSDEKRALIRNLFSNLTLLDKKVNVEPHPSVLEIVNRLKLSCGAPSRGVHRTWNALLKKLLKQFAIAPVDSDPIEADSPAQALHAAA